ncbi:MAG: class I SAM-dependent methyltransferase [Bdellovibrionota bacterium]
MAEHSRSHDYMKLRRGYPPELYEKILKMTGVPVSLLDVATGPGTVIKDMKENLSHAVGIDSDPERIMVAKFLTTPHIRFECISAEDFKPEKEFDLITVAQAFQYLSASAYKVLHHALKTNGVIAVFWKYPDPYSRTTELVNKVLSSHGLRERQDMGLRLAQTNPSGILSEWRFRDPELTMFKCEELFTHEDGIKSILWGLGTGNGSMDKELENDLTRDLALSFPGSITEIYDCYLWTARK